MEINRRDLFSLLRPLGKATPIIKNTLCTGQWGCRLCLSSCPRKAITEKGGVVQVETSLCDGCGCCSLACPWNALQFPQYSPDEIDRRLNSLLRWGKEPGEQRILLLHCKGAEQRWEGSFPRFVIPLPLPCLATPTSFVVLRAFELGADGVALLPCENQCRYGFGFTTIKEQVKFLHSVMSPIGLSPERLQVVDHEPLRQLENMQKQLSTQGPARRLAGEPRPKPFPFPSLVITDLLKLAQPAPRFSLEGNHVPCGLVEVRPDLCSLCGLCAKVCYSRALSVERKAGQLELLFHHAFCSACGECARICPDGAVKIRRGLDSRLLGELQILAEAPVVQCQLCGRNMIPAPLFDKIQKTLIASDLKLQNTLNMCPACRFEHFLKQKIMVG